MRRREFIAPVGGTAAAWPLGCMRSRRQEAARSDCSILRIDLERLRLDLERDAVASGLGVAVVSKPS
jgi:hypothetical protein